MSLFKTNFIWVFVKKPNLFDETLILNNFPAFSSDFSVLYLGCSQFGFLCIGYTINITSVYVISFSDN